MSRGISGGKLVTKICQYELTRPRLFILFKGRRYCIQKRNIDHHFHSWSAIIVFKDKRSLFFVV